jgi:hypothetical protein
MAEALTKIEAGTLQAFEAVIEKGLASFVEVGNSLMRIRDSKLYRGTHGTFEAYCQERWNIARRTAYQYIEAAEAVKVVRNCAQIEPANEAQARPLTLLETPAEQVAAWEQVIETAPKDDEGEPIITAKHVENVVREHLGDSEEKPLRTKGKSKPKASVAVWKEIAAHLEDAEAKFMANCQEVKAASSFLDAITECRRKLTYYIRTEEV